MTTPVLDLREVIRFRVDGKARPQGSKTLNRGGGSFREACDDLPAWRAAVSYRARLAMAGRTIIEPGTAIHLSAKFFGHHQKSHYSQSKGGGLRPSAPAFRATGYDLDKLVRAIGDAMSGIVYADDRQIAMTVSGKLWSLGPDRVEIVVSVIDPNLAAQPDAPRIRVECPDLFAQEATP